MHIGASVIEAECRKGRSRSLFGFGRLRVCMVHGGRECCRESFPIASSVDSCNIGMGHAKVSVRTHLNVDAHHGGMGRGETEG
jgi:hypothetical protein